MKRMLSMLLCSAALLMASVGCETKEPGVSTPTVGIAFEQDVLTIEGDEANHIAYFSLDERVEGLDVEPRCDAEWVTNMNVVASVLSFSVTKNEERLPRQTEIVLAYGDAMAKIRLVQNEATRRFDLFPLYNNSDIPYRIPAVAVTNDGTILACSDYRHSGADIGVIDKGRIDLHIRRSTDNGVTWDNIASIIEGQGAASPDFMNVGYGDPCIVADRESRRVLLMSCAGNVSYHAGTRDNHQNIARFYSEDGGMTWSKPTDIAESIYSKFDNCSYGPVNAMFIASGRVMQSRTVKVGDYYRLYCAIIMRDRSSSPKNAVLFSDDFGESWDVLGGASKAALSGNCDEPKVEELPDGSILISSRCNGGRNYNIFKFSNVASGTGSWGSATISGVGNGGVEARDNSTNGEVMLIPAVRMDDGANVDLLLQSVPLGPGRANVGIYYKALEDAADYASATKIAQDWEGVYQVTKLNSAYSTMAWQADGRLAFLWEETTYCDGQPPYGGYTIAYDCFTLEKLTRGKYSYRK